MCLGERDFSVQRRHKKYGNKRPLSPSAQERYHMIHVVIKAMQTFGYFSLGKIEFLHENGAFHFIEMNTQVQVEHPVTE